MATFRVMNEVKRSFEKPYKIKRKSELKIYEGFKDTWRSGQYTLSTNEGYMTFPTKKDALIYLEEKKIKFNKKDLK